ncbi:aspartate/glutamate racemase family protein [bacterium]|nr:MAG: aspartate/glutamate racemase family protein [bacterium]
MKTIGLIGGMSWESTAVYYRIINETVKNRLGGHHSARILLYSVDFSDVERLQREERWDDAAGLIVDAARRLERGGADFVLICTNTMHRSAEQVMEAVDLPLLHIVEATISHVLDSGCRKAGLLGTRFTMESDLFTNRVSSADGLDIIIPEASDRESVHRVIYEELVQGRVKEDARKEFVRIIGVLTSRGAEGIILGCTELSLLITQGDSPVTDSATTEIHARAAADYALT